MALRYHRLAERPGLSLWLQDDDGGLIDFSVDYTFTFRIGNPGSQALLTKTGGIVGSLGSGNEPDGDPNVQITWSSGDLNIVPGTYAWQLKATTSGLDRYFSGVITILEVVLGGSGGEDPGSGLNVVAADVEVDPSGNLLSDNVADALVELQGDIDVGVGSGFTFPEEFNADRLNDTNDDTAAIQAAIDTGGNVLLRPGGQYLISDTLLMDAAVGETLMGNNSRDTRIVMTDRTKPIIRVDGEHKKIAGVRLEYQGGSFTNVGTPVGADAIYAHRMRWSEIDDVMIINCEKGVHAPQETGIGGFFSNTINKLRVLGFSEYALDINSWSGTGNTGSAWSNIYLANNPSGTILPATGVVRFRTMMDSTFNQLNIESVECVEHAMLFSSVEGMSISGLHFEGVEVINDFSSFIRLFGSRTKVDVRSMQFIGCEVNQPSRGRIFQVDSSSMLQVGSIALRSNVVTSPNFTLAGTADGGVGCLVDVQLMTDEHSDLTALTDGFSVATPPTVRRIGDNHYYLDTLYSPI